MKIPPVKALIFMKKHSVRLPGKNVKPLCNRPLFHWIMDSLSNSKYVKEIIINTDSIEIAEDAKKHFNVTIHMRPDYLLNIQSNEADQIMEYDLTKTEGEFFLQTHSTTPLVRSETLDLAVEAFFNQDTHDSLISVTPIQKRFYSKDGKAINHEPYSLIKTQHLPCVYEENSCIYMFSRTIFDEYKHRIGRNPLMFPMDRYESIDIDEEIDFVLAESLMKYKLKGKL